MLVAIHWKQVFCGCKLRLLSFGSWKNPWVAISLCKTSRGDDHSFHSHVKNGVELPLKNPECTGEPASFHSWSLFLGILLFHVLSTVRTGRAFLGPSLQTIRVKGMLACGYYRDFLTILKGFPADWTRRIAMTRTYRQGFVLLFVFSQSPAINRELTEQSSTWLFCAGPIVGELAFVVQPCWFQHHYQTPKSNRAQKDGRLDPNHPIERHDCQR